MQKKISSTACMKKPLAINNKVGYILFECGKIDI
jgi:hypothetical protein